MEDLRQGTETTKRILTKDKAERQLAGQSTLTPVMNTKDSTGCNNKVVSYDIYNVLYTKQANAQH